MKKMKETFARHGCEFVQVPAAEWPALRGRALAKDGRPSHAAAFFASSWSIYYSS